MRFPVIAAVFAVCLPSLLFAGDFQLDFSKNANMGFKDQVAGDGKGGWSDQGPENDFADFDFKRGDYEGVAFSILDPAKNGGKAVMTFDSPHARTGLKEASFKIGREKGPQRFLYLLHTSCWNQAPSGKPIGSVEVEFAGGSGVQKEIRAGIDIVDWWNPASCKNALPVVKKENKSSEVGVFLTKIPLDSQAREIESLRFRGYGEVVWIVLGATLSNKDAPIGEGIVVFKPGAEWKAVDMGDVQVKPGSALDLSGFLEPGPAGSHGRAVVAPKGALAFADSPDIPRRLFAFTGFFHTIRTFESPTKEERDAKIEKFAGLVRRQGYNLVRPLVSDGYLMEGSEKDGVFNPAKRDLFDKMLAALKKEGVYSYVTVAAYCVGFKDRKRAFEARDEIKLKMLLGDEETRRNWKSTAKELLEHVNPYTGLALRDDPSLVCVEIYNEHEIGFGAARIEKMDASLRKSVLERWRSWLEAKYKTPEAMAQALGTKGPFEAQKLESSGALGAEFNLFVLDLAEECLAWCSKVVKESGYPGLISQYNFAKSNGFNALRWKLSPVVSMNGYFNHPSQFTRPGSRCGQNSSVASAAGYFRGIAGTRLAGRPLFVTEHNHAFWNKYQHEDGLLFGGYSALQGFSAVMVHEDAVALTVEQPNIDFSVARSPVARANEFVAGCLYMRGDAKSSPGDVQLQFPDASLKKLGAKAVSTEQSKIALMTGFSVAFPDLKAADGLPTPPQPELSLLPDGGAEISAGEWAAGVKESKAEAFSIDAFAKTLKERGVLPSGNISAPAEGLYQSDTGELVSRAKEKLLKATTSRTEGVSLEAGKAERMDKFSVLSSSVPASVALCSMDGEPLGSCGRAVLVYSTEIVNSGMELSEDRVTLIKPGSLPTLMRCGELKATFENPKGAKMSLYALGYDGSRRERLALKASGGVLEISLDTAKLKDGPTPFFELVAE